MERTIEHIHIRRYNAPREQVAVLIDQLWSRSARDALPRQLSGWRKNPHGSEGMAAGTRFGHGPFSFRVEHWDGHSLRAGIETAGFRGYHGFTLRTEDGATVVTHELRAALTLPRWALWQLLIARGHDWAVEAMFDRLQALLEERAETPLHVPPLGMRMFAAARRLAS